MESYHTNTTMSRVTNSSSSESSSSEISAFNKLKSKWNLWAHLPHDPKWTDDSYVKICQFNCVEETIAITESLPEDFVKNCMLFIMRDGVMPKWEDPRNRNGGCFSYKVHNKYVFEVWRELTYCLVGETISTNNSFVNSVIGITISPKKNFCIVKIWLTNCDYQNPQIVTGDVKYLFPQGCLFKKHTPEF